MVRRWLKKSAQAEVRRADNLRWRRRQGRSKQRGDAAEELTGRSAVRAIVLNVGSICEIRLSAVGIHGCIPRERCCETRRGERDHGSLRHNDSQIELLRQSPVRPRG